MPAVPLPLAKALRVAIEAARAAGALMHRHLNSAKAVDSATQHDLKLALDVRCQAVIGRRLLAAFPGTAILGEEGADGDPRAPWRWVVDPIDGTVNFAYGIPHACVSIALQRATPRQIRTSDRDTAFVTLVGVVYDPFCDELWTAVRGRRAQRNGRPIRVSDRRRLPEAVISLGFGKRDDVLQQMLPAMNALTHRVRKIRIMGSAALALAYVASGRFDAFVESGVRLWDIAAGSLILECAGGRCWTRALAGSHTYALNATNGHLHRALRPFALVKPLRT